MRKGISIAVILFLVLQGLAEASTIVRFGDNRTEEAVALPGHNMTTVLNISVPADSRVIYATLNVSAMAPDASHPGWPEAVKVALDDTVIWEFKGTGYGAFGMQNVFGNGTSGWTHVFGSGGGNGNTTVRMPKGASVRNAVLEVSGCIPGLTDQLINFTGEAAYDYLGESVSNAGDVNGDGYDDVIVGAYQDGEVGSHVGKAYIYFGGASMDNTPDLTMTGEGDKNYYGGWVSGAGDVNGDGFDDVIVGAYGNSAAGSFAGRAYLYFGGAKMDNTADLVFTGEAKEDRMGISASGAGDVNGDGYVDVIVGAHTNDAGGLDAGRVYIYYGGASMDNTADKVLTGNIRQGHFGCSVSDAGDLNGDGYDDVIVGALNANRAYIFFGGASINSTADVNLTGDPSDSFYGRSVSGAGDLNQDGYDDVIVGSEQGGDNSEGYAYVYFGGASMDNATDVTFEGEAAQNYFGQSVSGAGDVNGDGCSDVVVGALGYDGDGQNTGRAYVYYCGAGSDTKPDMTFTGEGSGDLLGGFVSGAGDVNNDGHDEVIVGAPSSNRTCGADAGAAYIYAYKYSSILDPAVFVGPKTIWNRIGYFNSSNMTGDFAQEINDYIWNAIPSGSDGYGNDYVDVPVNVSAGSAGDMSLGKLNITYDLTAAVPDFAKVLNTYLDEHRLEQDAYGNLSVPLYVWSQSSGRVRLQDLMIFTDRPPTRLGPIPDFKMDEDTFNPQIADLYQYFKDDNENVSRLRFTLVKATNGMYVTTKLVDGRYISVDASTGSQNDNWTGVVEIIVEVSDSTGSTTVSNSFKVMVVDVPDPPIITTVPPLNASSGQKYGYHVEAEDGDNDALDYSLAKCPPSMDLDESTGDISWVPTKGGRYDVSVVVSDGRFTVFQNYTVDVPNRLPRVTNTMVPVAYVNASYTYNITAVDDDLDVLAYALMSNVPGMVLDAGTGRLQWTPTQVGVFAVSVGIDDGNGSITYDFNITVLQGNRAPQFQMGAVPTAIAGLPYVYSPGAVDLDGDVLTYALVEMPLGMTINASSGRIEWTPGAAGNYSVMLKVMDGKGEEAVLEFSVNVSERVKAKVDFTSPSDGKKVGGKVTVTGRAVNGTLAVVKVQVKVDSGEWTDVLGISSWQHVLDTSKLKNGKHTLQARAYDGMDYSDPVNMTIVVDNAVGGGTKVIPGFEGLGVGAAIAIYVILIEMRKRTRG